MQVLVLEKNKGMRQTVHNDYKASVEVARESGQLKTCDLSDVGEQN